MQREHDKDTVLRNVIRSCCRRQISKRGRFQKAQCHKRYVKALQKWPSQEQKTAKLISKTKVVPEVCLPLQANEYKPDEERAVFNSYTILTWTRPKT